MSELWLISGCPGAGKTTSLARQAKRAAEAHGPSSVAITSLTRTAASEIGGRDTGIPDDNVGTLHAHCYRALDQPDLAETPEALRDWNDTHPAAKINGSADQLEDTPLEHAGADDVHARVMANRARMLPRDEWTLEERDHDHAWSDYKQQTGRLDFTDLIEKAIAEIPMHPAAPAALFGDEAQDFSALELTLFQQWAAHAKTAVLAGDLDQALYTWRGAGPDRLAALPFTGVKHLDRSYRVPAAVRDVALQWIHRTANPHRTDYKPTDDVGAVRQSAVSLRYTDPLAAELEDITSQGRTAMILTSCGYMLAPVLKTLRDQGIPFHNPYRTAQGAWNPLRSAGRLLAYLRADEEAWGDRARAWTWEDLRTWTEPLQASTALARGAKALIEEKCRPDRFGETADRGREVPLDTLAELLGDPGDLSHPAFHGDVGWWAGQLRASKRKQMTYPLEILRRRGAAALREQPMVIVGTAHSVKGGECDEVLLFPDLSRTGYYHGWHPEGPGRDAIVRMFYVAMTRARETLTVLTPAGAEHAPVDQLLAGRQLEAVAA